MHAARLRFSLTPSVASAVHAALQPEARAPDDADDVDALAPALARSRTRVLLEDGDVVLHLEADDLPALRAAVNSHVRLVDAAARAARLAD